MSSPVTVLLPVYNGLPYLAESIESILQQRYKNFELLIIDDGSTDGSTACISQYQDPRIRFICHKTNQGLISTLNHGLMEARHELIARHDQDDIAYPERLQSQVDLMDKHPEIGVCGTGAYILENGHRGKKIIFPASDLLIRWTLPFYCPLIHPSIMYRRSVVLLVSGYSIAKEANYAEDYDMWLRLLSHTKFHNVKRPLMDLRKHQTNMTIDKQEYHLQQTAKITKKYVDQALNRDVPLDLICWLRRITTHTKFRSSRAKLMLSLYTNFISHNTMSLPELARVTAYTAIRMIGIIRDNLRLWIGKFYSDGTKFT